MISVLTLCGKRPMPRRRSFPIPTQESLSNAALHYLSRFAASEESLRRMLLTKLRRAAAAHPEFAADHDRQAALRLQIEGIVARHKVSGAVNDKAFADMKVASLRRAGKSRRAIRQKLGQKGIPARLISEALEGHAQDAALDDGAGDAAAQAEWGAALAFARKRRLGPFRASETGAEEGRLEHAKNASIRQKVKIAKDAAALIRAGFAPALASKVLGLSREDLELDATQDI